MHGWCERWPLENRASDGGDPGAYLWRSLMRYRCLTRGCCGRGHVPRPARGRFFEVRAGRGGPRRRDARH
jgi:hypothetical protein